LIIISHRGNTNGINCDLENHPDQIDLLTSQSINVEIDVWVKSDQIFLGHDEPKYKVNESWLSDKIEYLWIHCKSFEAVNFFYKSKLNFNYFFHQNDELTLTSHGFIWVYPGKTYNENAIIVCKNINDLECLDKKKPLGICSDYISKLL
jgi:hypothetical protein